MAGAAMQNVDNSALIQNLLQGLTAVKGKTSTQTTSSNISSEGLNSILQQALSSSNGLASVASGQKQSGLYGSNTNQMMINDLLTRTSGELASRQAGSTTTNKQQPQVGAKDLLTLLGSMAGTKVLGPTVKGIGKKTGLTDGLDSVGNKLADALGLGSNSALAPTSSGGSALSGVSTEMMAGSNAASVGAGVGSGGLSGIGNALAADGSILGASSVGDMLTAANATADPLGSFIGSLGYDTSALAGSAVAETAGTAAAAATGAEVATTAAGAAEGAGIADAVVTFFSWLFSDARLKTDIRPVGETNAGQTIYTYKYKDNPITTHMGVMAQESPKSAVAIHPSGALMVDYSKIL